MLGTDVLVFSSKKRREKKKQLWVSEILLEHVLDNKFTLIQSIVTEVLEEEEE